MLAVVSLTLKKVLAELHDEFLSSRCLQRLIMRVVCIVYCVQQRFAKRTVKNQRMQKFLKTLY